MNSTLGARRRVAIASGTVRVHGTDAPPPLRVGTTPRVVGRSPGCDLLLHDARVSAAHCELVGTDHGVRVRDLGSRNGTFLDGHRIVEAYLSRRATLQCGDTELRFAPTEPERVELARPRAFGRLVGGASSMRMLFERARVLAEVRAPLSVLILGETGTGKELVAQAIHAASPRAAKPFVVVDCGAIPATLAESTLFGHERGAFTGAVKSRLSPFVEADGGTVFLDELGELPLDVQPKLLRVLDQRRVKAVGASAYVPVDVRVLSATRRDLRREMNAGSFRSDLFFRIAQERIELPPLRERREDIPALVEHMLEAADAGAFARVTPESFDRAERHDWPGNVRELANVVAVALAFAGEGPIDLGRHIGSSQSADDEGAAAGAARTFAEAKTDFERAYFGALHRQCGRNVSAIAERAGVDRKTARAQLRRHRFGA